MSFEPPVIEHKKTVTGGVFRIGRDAIMSYKNDGADGIIVNHTRVAKHAEGKGLGRALYRSMVDYARSQNLKVTPACSYVKTQFERSPADADVLSS
ncbi:MAG: GNAT family N-acetyltransferase [Lysobacterales bacterium]